MKKYNVTVNGTVYEVMVEEIADGAVSAPAAVNAAPAAPAAASAPKAAPAPTAAQAAPKSAGSKSVNAPMPGTIVKMIVKEGDAVKKGDVLCLLEAMKMENEICAPDDAVVATVDVKQGASVATGDLILTLK